MSTYKTIYFGPLFLRTNCTTPHHTCDKLLQLPAWTFKMMAKNKHVYRYVIFRKELKYCKEPMETSEIIDS